MLMVELRCRSGDIDKKGQIMSEYSMLLHEIKELKDKLLYEIEDLKKELQNLEEDIDDEENTINDEHILANIAKQLGIIVVPDMPQWALLLDIERAIEDVKNSRCAI